MTTTNDRGTEREGLDDTCDSPEAIGMFKFKQLGVHTRLS